MGIITGTIKKVSNKVVAAKDAVKDNVGRKKSVLSFLWKDARGQLSEMGSALKREPETGLTFDEVSRRWRVDPETDAPERAARLNLGMAIFFLTICVWCIVQLAHGLAEHLITASAASVLAFFASFVVGVASLWRYQVFSSRKYLPFFQWFKRGGTLFAGLVLAGAVAASAMSPPVSFAEISINLPTNVEVQKDNDISAGILRLLFGEAWTTIAGSKGYVITTGKNPWAELIVAVLGTLNLAALGYLSVLIMYMWGIFTISTAHEGKKLGGGVYNSLWVPARHALSFTMTVPVLKGLSLLQVAIIACIGLGINFANIVWDAASKFISENTTENFTQMSNNLSDEAYKMIGGIYEASVFQLVSESLASIADNVKSDPNDRTIRDYPQAYRSIEKPTDEYGNKCEKETYKSYVTIFTCGTGINKRIEIVGTPVRGDKMDKSSLGFATLNASDSKSTTVLEARKQEILKLWDDTRQIAKNYLISPDSLNSKYGYHAGMNKVETKDFATLINNYSTSVREKTSDAVKSYLISSDDLQSKIGKSINYEKGSGSTYGWITAGMCSFFLASLQKKIDDASYSKIDYTPPDSKKLRASIEKGWGTDEKLAYANSNAYFANKVNTDIHYSSTVLGTKDPNIIEKPILAILKTIVLDSESREGTPPDVLSSVLKKFDQGEPMVPIQALGDRFVNASYIALGVGVAMNVGGSLLSTFAGPAGGILNSISSHFMGMLLIFGIAALIAGIMMGYVMPITPFIIWLRACLTWIFQAIEALVAAPFWACVHAMPKGEGFAGDQARSGYYLLLDLAIRPVLLVLGAVFVISITRVLGKLYNILFNLWFTNATAFLDMGVTANVVYAVVVISTMYYLIITVNQMGVSFLPDRTMKWLGSSISSLGGGENDMHQKVNQTVGMFHSTGSQALTGMRALGGQNKLGGGGGGDDKGGGGDQGGGGGGGQAAQHIAKKGGQAATGAASAAGSAGASAGSAAAGSSSGSEGAGKQIASKDEVSGGGKSQKGSGGDSGSNTDILSPRASMGMDDEATKKKLKIAGDAMSGGGASAAGAAGGGVASQIGGKLG